MSNESVALLLLNLFVIAFAAAWVRYFHDPAWLRMQVRLEELDTLTRTLSRDLEKRSQFDGAGFSEYLPQAVAEPGTGMLNLTKRTQALRLLREGQTPQQVAKRLHITRGEVELMMKVSQLYVS